MTQDHDDGVNRPKLVMRTLYGIDRGVVLAVALAVSIFLGSLIGLAALVDSTARQREEAQAANGLQIQVQELAARPPVQLAWDEAILNLDNHFNYAWAKTNIGEFFCGTLGYSFVYVLDARDQPEFGMHGDQTVPNDRFALFRAAALPLLRSVREQEKKRGRLMPPFKAHGDIAQPIQSTNISRSGTALFVMTATLVQPSNGDALPVGSRSPIVISGKQIDESFLQTIANRQLLSNLRLIQPDGRADAYIDIAGPAGEKLGRIAWTPNRPGAYLVSIAMIPILIAVCLPLVLYFRSRRIARQLQDAMKKLEEISVTDALTGLHNRRFLLKNIDVDASLTIRRHEGYFARKEIPRESDLLFFMLDIDHFKAVNDKLGHQAGDAILVQMSERLHRTFRDADYLVRWGGEEFLVVARGSDRERATEIAERIRQLIGDEPFRLDNGNDLTKTCSIGFAAFPFVVASPRALTWLQVVELADQALYMAKHSGRNTWFGLAATAETDPEHLVRQLSKGREEGISIKEEELEVLSGGKHIL